MRAIGIEPELAAEIQRISEKAEAAAETIDVNAGDEADPEMDGLLEQYGRLSSGLSVEEPKEYLVYHCKYIQASTARRVLEGFLTLDR